MKLKSLAIMAALLGVQAAFADVAFDNFGPGDSFNYNGGWLESGPTSLPGGIVQAFRFKSAATGSLKSITVAHSVVNGTNAGSLTLFEDSGFGVGNVITTWYYNNLPKFGTVFAPIVLNNGFPSIVLTAGTSYWLEADPGANDTWSAWNINTTGALGIKALSTDGGATYSYTQDETMGAFRVETVPEPASMAILGLGALALRRRRKA